MRPRPTSATNRQLIAVAMFLATGCIWWRAAPFVKEEIGHARTLLGLGDKPEPTFASQFDESDKVFPPGAKWAPMGRPPAPYQPTSTTQMARYTAP